MNEIFIFVIEPALPDYLGDLLMLEKRRERLYLENWTY